MPPARATSADLAVRSTTPRSQSTIFPSAFAGSRTPGPQSSGASAPSTATEPAVTSGPLTGSVTVMEAPGKASPFPRVAVAS
jgi:hypothetical protein